MASNHLLRGYFPVTTQPNSSLSAPVLKLLRMILVVRYGVTGSRQGSCCNGPGDRWGQDDNWVHSSFLCLSFLILRRNLHGGPQHGALHVHWEHTCCAQHGTGPHHVSTQKARKGQCCKTMNWTHYSIKPRSFYLYYLFNKY